MSDRFPKWLLPEGPAGLGVLAFRVFVAFGGLMILGGLALAFDDPGGFALVVFGLVFVGAGLLARRLFTPAKSMKYAEIPEDGFQTRRMDGLHGTVERSVLIEVAEDADPEAIAAATSAWAADRFAARPDWVAGRVLQETERRGGMHRLAAGVWTVFALGALGAALLWGDIAWLVLMGAAPVAAGLVFMAVRDGRRRRRFGRSLFLMETTPGRLGRALVGAVQTEIPAGRPPIGGFQVALRCYRRWEESVGSHSASPTRTRLRTETIWETTAASRPAVGESSKLAAPVRIDVPADLSPTSLSGANDGVFWELEVSAKTPGLDYGARFLLPILRPETEVGPGSPA